MNLEYSLEEEDFLTFQFYTASKSNRIKRKKKAGWILLTLGAIILTFYFYLDNETTLTYYFAIVSVATAIFYPKYFKWRYKKHYSNYIQENYSKQIGLPVTIYFGDSIIKMVDKTGESKINNSEIEIVNETMHHFFIKISTGLSLIIPKTKVHNLNGLKETFAKLNFSINCEPKWKW